MRKIKNKLKKIGWFESLAIIFVIVATGKFAYIKHESKSLKRVVPLSLSMYPTLQVGKEYVFKEINEGTEINRFDIVNFMVESKSAYPKYNLNVNCESLIDKKNYCYQQEHLPFAKRVVGIPGDKIKYFENSVMVNGKEMRHLKQNVKDVKDIKSSDVKNKGLYEFYNVSFENNNHLIALVKDRSTIKNRSGFFILGSNEYFMIGDNRNLSLDSRNFGLINKKDITHIMDDNYIENK